jgi:hypothetical protein
LLKELNSLAPLQADCDDLDAAKATLKGLQKRHALGVTPIFINTVGVVHLSGWVYFTEAFM